MPWVVAKFHSKRDDGLTLNTIPSSWITKVGDKNYALYPPIDISGSELKRLVYKGEDPGDDWDLLHLKYVSTCFETIIEALDFECKAGDLSETDLAAFEKTGTIGKRKRKAKDIRYPNEPVSSEDEDVKEITDPLSLSASEIKRKAETVISPSRAIEVPCKSVGGTDPGSSIKVLLSSAKAVKLMQNSVVKPREIITAHKANEHKASSSILRTNTAIPENGDDDDEDVKDLIKKIEQRVTCQMDLILEKIRCMRETIEMLSSKDNNIQAVSDPEEEISAYDDSITLPVETFEDLMSLQNEIISTPKFRRYMLKTLKIHAVTLEYKGIPCLNRTVNSILSTLMTSNVARMLCMKGPSKNKVSFQLNFSKLLYLIYDVVRAKKISGPDVDMNSMKRSMGEWLRQARNRSDRDKILIKYYGDEGGTEALEDDDNSILS